MTEDLEPLVADAKEGDHQAFEGLVRATYADTYTLAYRLTGNEADASDVVQDAYLRAYRGLSRFRGDARFTTWMYRITANCAATHVGKRKRHQHDELAEDAQVIDEHPALSPEARAEASDLRARLAVAVEDLPPKLRSVVVLRDVYDLPHDAIAQELGITTSAAKVRLHRARRALRAAVYPLPTEERAHAV